MAAMNTVCGILISLVVNVLGIAIFAYFHSNPARLDPLAQNDKIVPLFVDSGAATRVHRNGDRGDFCLGHDYCRQQHEQLRHGVHARIFTCASGRTRRTRRG